MSTPSHLTGSHDADPRGHRWRDTPTEVVVLIVGLALLAATSLWLVGLGLIAIG